MDREKRIEGLKKGINISQEKLSEAKETNSRLTHELSLEEGKNRYEVKISNVIYETRTCRADSEEEAQEKIENDLNNYMPHVEESECEGAEIYEVMCIDEDIDEDEDEVIAIG
jgi:hypothetical protein